MTDWEAEISLISQRDAKYVPGIRGAKLSLLFSFVTKLIPMDLTGSEKKIISLLEESRTALLEAGQLLAKDELVNLKRAILEIDILVLRIRATTSSGRRPTRKEN